MNAKFTLDDLIQHLNNDRSFVDEPNFKIRQEDVWYWDGDYVAHTVTAFDLYDNGIKVGSFIQALHDGKSIAIESFYPALNCTWGTICTIREYTGWNL